MSANPRDFVSAEDLQYEGFGLKMGILLSVLSSMLELEQAIRQIRSPATSHPIRFTNHNWSRIADLTFACLKVAAWFAAYTVFFTAIFAAPLVVAGILVGIAAVSVARAVWAAFKWALTKGDDPACAGYRGDLKRHVPSALLALAAVGLYFAMMFSPVGLPVITAISTAGMLVGVGFLVFAIIQRIRFQYQQGSVRETLPYEAPANNVNDQGITQAATVQIQASRPYFDYHYADDHAKVISRLYSPHAAIQYCQTELQRQRALLSGFLHDKPSSLQSRKWRDKVVFLSCLHEFVHRLEAGTAIFEKDDSFETALIHSFLPDNQVVTQFNGIQIRFQDFMDSRRRAFQSVMHMKGKVETIYLGVQQLYSQLKDDGFNGRLAQERVNQPQQVVGPPEFQLGDQQHDFGGAQPVQYGKVL